MTKHFAFDPITGGAVGPWYPVNQEKIIGLIYYHVKNTGDTKFLNEVVSGKTVLEHAIINAMYGDDPAKPVGFDRLWAGQQPPRIASGHSLQPRHARPERPALRKLYVGVPVGRVGRQARAAACPTGRGT